MKSPAVLFSPAERTGRASPSPAARRRIRCAQWWFGGMGRPKFLSREQVPDPQPKPGEVLIRVKAIGVNFADLLQRMGLYPGTPKPPFVPGLEIAGVVEKTAEGGSSPRAQPLRPGRCGRGSLRIQRLRRVDRGSRASRPIACRRE